MLKNIYVKKSNETFWKRAEEAAERRGMSLSSWVSNLLRLHFIEVSTGQKAEPTAEEMLDDIAAQVAALQEQLASEPKKER